MIYTRRQITDAIQQAVAPDKKVRTVPAGLVKAFLPLIKMVNKNLYDKMAFFIWVMEEDTLADKVRAGTLEENIFQNTEPLSSKNYG